MVGHALAGQREQLFEAARGGDDGGAGVEGEALVLVDVGAAAGLVALFEERGRDAGRLQADGQRQAAEAAADDGGARWRAVRASPRIPQRAPAPGARGTGGRPASRRRRSTGGQVAGIEARDQGGRAAIELLQHAAPRASGAAARNSRRFSSRKKPRRRASAWSRTAALLNRRGRQRARFMAGEQVGRGAPRRAASSRSWDGTARPACRCAARAPVQNALDVAAQRNRQARRVPRAPTPRTRQPLAAT